MTHNRTRNTPTAQRRQCQIEDCLFENLTTTSWQSISVADICRQVGISRKAYYNYYKDKTDCFCSYVDRFFNDCIQYTRQHLGNDASALDMAVTLLEFWKEHKTFLDVIVRNDLLSILINRNVDYVLNQDRTLLDLLGTEAIPTDEDILTCYTSIQISLLLRWHKRNFDTPVEEMAKKFLRLLTEPLIPVQL